MKSKIKAKSVINTRVTGLDSAGFGGEPGVVWERELSELYPGAMRYYLVGNIKLSDGNFLASGYVGYSDRDSSGHAYIKYNRDGVVLWKGKVVGINNFSLGLLPTKDSGFAATNERNRDSIYRRFVKKYNKSGIQEWEAKIEDTLTYSESIIATPDGGYLTAYLSDANGQQLVCSTANSIFNEGIYFDRISLLRLNSQGGVLWRKDVFRQNDPGFTSFSSVNVLKTTGGYFLVGNFSYQNGDSTRCWNLENKTQDIFVGKIDEAGDSLMLKFYGGSRDDGVFSVFSSLKDSGIVILGQTKSKDRDLFGLRSDTIYADGWMLKLNDTGRIELNSVFRNAPNSDNILVSGFEMSDSSFVLSAGAQNTTSFISSVMKVARTGTVEWIKNETSGIFLEVRPDGDEITYAKFLSEETEGYFGKLGASSFITGTVFFDLNKNNVKDPAEPFANKFLVTSSKPGYSRSSVAQNGWFRNDVDTGTYKTTVQLNNNYYVAVPAEKQTTFTSLFQKDTVHFALQPVAGKRDLSISLLPLTPARPGFTASYKLLFRNNGTDTIANGAAVLLKDPRVTVVSTVPAAHVMQGDSLVWLFGAFKPFDEYSINIELKTAVPPALNNGDTLRYVAAIIPSTGIGTDLTPLNDTARLAQLVVGSYDPNDKQENVAGKMPLAKITAGEHIQYLIRFQNTGTDTAFTVQITDTLDAKLNWSSFQMIAASHAYKIKVSDGNKITWTFSNINLPDSNRNNLLSNGFISFTIKPKTSLAGGDYFQNKAAIYFDYNLPVITNTATTVVSTAVVTGVRPQPNADMQVLALPNPSNGDLYLKLSGKLTGKFEYSVIDIYGRVLQTQVIERNNSADVQLVPLRLNGLSKAVYFIVVRQKGKQWKQQIVIQ